MNFLLSAAAGALLFSSSIVDALDSKTAAAYGFNNTFPEIEEHDGVGVNGWVSYKQCDGAWANQQLGYCSLTICSAGIFILLFSVMLLCFIYVLFLSIKCRMCHELCCYDSCY